VGDTATGQTAGKKRDPESGEKPKKGGSAAGGDPGGTNAARGRKPRRSHQYQCPNPSGLRVAAGIKIQNVADQAVFVLRQSGPRAAIQYLVGHQVDPALAEHAVNAGMTPKPPRSTIMPEEGRREFCVGRTPRVYETLGKTVLARMIKEGKAYEVKGGEPMVSSEDPDTHEIGWYKLSDCTMGHHPEPVVLYWNRLGRTYHRPGGEPAPEVRDWMNDEGNYIIEFGPHNYSKGARLKNAGHAYLDPVPTPPGKGADGGADPGPGAAHRTGGRRPLTDREVGRG
jgi:hypothetical protein